jgi:hypothetical protein
LTEKTSVAEPHNFYASPDKNFSAAPALTTLLMYVKSKFLKLKKGTGKIKEDNYVSSDIV